jgi:hypothetical protein
MLIGTEDIVRYKGNINIQQLGGESINGYAEIAMSKETGVVFIAQFVNNTLDKFTVGAFNTQGILEEKRDYAERTERDFFAAVKYFEELVKNRQPEQEQAPPSVGKFYFFKKAIGKDAYVAIEGMQDIIIDAADIPTVFSPPKTKPLGRLNLKDATNPKYDPIKAKFALKYLEDEAKEMATANNWNLSDFAVYDMTPYEIGDENEGEPSPDDVNPVNPNDIEDEDFHKKPPHKKPDDKEPKKDKKPKPKVGDVIKIRDNYGIVESIDNGRVKVRKLTRDEATNILSQKRSSNTTMDLGGEIKDEDNDFFYLEIDDENSEVEILQIDENPTDNPPEPPDNQEDADEIAFFRVPNTTVDVLDLLLYSENIKTGDITNKKEKYQFIVSKREGDNFKGTAVGLNVQGEATLIRKIKYDGADGTGYLLTAEGEDGPPKADDDEISFVLVSDISGNVINGDLFSKNKVTNAIANLNQQITFNVKERIVDKLEGKVNGIDGKVIMLRVNSLDQDGKQAYYLLQEGEEQKDGEPVDEPIDIHKLQDRPDRPNTDAPMDTPPVNPKDLKEALEVFTNSRDLKRSFRKQRNLLDALSTYTEKELNKLLSDLKLPPNMNKQQFINLVEKETKTIFN